MNKSITKTILSIVKISRPNTWLSTTLPFAIGYLVAGGPIGLSFVLGVIYFSLGINLLIHGVDIMYSPKISADHTSNQTQNARPSDRTMWLVISLANLPFLLYFLRLNSGPISALFIAIMAIALGYSLKGVRLKERPIIDAVSTSLVHVAPFIFGLVLAASNTYYPAATISFLLWSMAGYSFKAIGRISTDRAAGINSIATALGVKRTANLSFWLYVAAAVIVALSYGQLGLISGLLLGSYALNVSFFKKYKSDAQSYQYRRGIRNFTWLNLIIGFWLILIILYHFDFLALGQDKILLTTNVLICISLFQTLLIIHNLLGFRRPKTDRLSEWPKVSIIMHAYNQADNITSTMLALIGQNYPDLEIIFADTNSTDNTLKIVEEYNDPRVKIIQLPKRKKGWTVNAHGANELLRHASGKFVILLSADTILKPNAVSAFASLMTNKKLDLMSLLPADQNKTLAQKLVLSQNQFLLLGVYPAAYLTKNLPQFASAYAGLMVFDRERIESIGGFSLVKNSPLEDHDLAAQAKLNGLKTGFYLGSDIAVAQNHASLRLILEQNIRRYYPMLHFNMPLAIGLFTLGGFFFVGPVVMLLYQIAFHGGQATIGLLIVIAIGLLNRLIVALRTRQSTLGVVIYPIANLIALIEILISMLNYELLKPRWLERTGVN